MSSTGRVRTHRARPDMLRERLETNCDCGQAVAVVIEHYQRVACRACGKIFWALQPHRNGGMKLFPWPGNTATTPQTDNGE